MRVLWTHNYDPGIANSGVFMHNTVEGVRARGVDLHLHYLGNLRSIPQLLRAREQVRRLAADFDLVHAQFGSACALATAAATTVPKVVTICGSDWHTHSATRGFFYFHTRLAALFTKLALGSYDGVLAVSQRLAAEVAQAAHRAQVAVAPHPVDLARFVPRDKQEARALLGHPGCTEKWILFNSLRLNNPIKRVALAEQAVAMAQARCGNVRLRIASGLAHDAMPLFVAACDLILCTSDNEGWPNSVKEALACNVPFVATDVSDLRAIAEVEPSCRVCPADPQLLAASICDVLQSQHPVDLRRYVAGMSVPAVSDQIVSFYQSVLARRRETTASPDRER
jgi:glycosyltransferase involved in cell wall biosynthesis